MSINKQISLTILLLIFSIIFFGISSIDITIQDYLYNQSTNSWILDRDLEPYKFIFYDGIKKLLILFALSFLIALIFFKNKKIVQEYKKGIVIVIFSAILIPLTVGGLKKATNMPCPKNEQHYGGKMVKTAVWQSYTKPYKDMERIACWPAGHANAGFALLSLFFLFKTKKTKFIALSSALVIGWSMGIYKMLIGDHFFSHNIITMLIAWLLVLIISKIVNKKII